jgi:membrane dipeptidase
LYQAQLDAYHRLSDDHPDKFQIIHTLGDLQSVLDHWADAGVAEHPVGLVILMEGAEGVRAPGELEDWWARGVRLIGPAWAGTRFCGGTREPGPLTPEGYALLEAMAGFGFTLDISHMDEQAAFQALDTYPGAVVATHSNAIALLKGADSNRFLSDRLIQALLERDGRIGVVPYNRFLLWGWTPTDRRQVVSLRHVVAQIDYICQKAGDAKHVGIGSDFDGGFGLEAVPNGVDTVADLQKLGPLLAEKGYTEEEIAAVLGENWISLLQQTLPESA